MPHAAAPSVQYASSGPATGGGVAEASGPLGYSAAMFHFAFMLAMCYVSMQVCAANSLEN